MCEEKKSGGSAKWLHPVSLIFHIAGMALAVAAAAVMASANQCTVYADYGSRPRTISYSDFPSFVYLVAATSIAAPLEAVALFLSVSKKQGESKKAWRVLMALLGAIVPALLYTSAGAAFAAGVDISYYLEPSGRRFGVCRSSVGGRFCGQVHMSMWLALLAALAVSIAEYLSTMQRCHGGGGGSGGGGSSDSDSDSDSVSACGHGCHCKH